MSRAATALLSLAFLVAAVAAVKGYPADLSDGWTVPKEGVLLLAVALLVAPWALRSPLARWDRLDRQALVLAGVTVLSGALATNLWLAWRATALTLGAVALFVWSREREGVRLPALLASSAVAASVCLEDLGLTLPSSMTASPGGTLGTREAATLLLCVATPALAVLQTARRGLAARLVLVVALLLHGFAAGVARSGYEGLLGLGFVLALVFVPPAARRPLLGWGIAPAAVGLLLGLVRANPSPGTATAGVLGPWWPVVREHLLVGVGPGNLPVFAPRVGAAAFPGELGAFLVERGLLGVAVAGMLGLGVVRVVRARQRAGDDGSVAAVFATFACALLTVPPLSPLTLMVAALLLGAGLPRTSPGPLPVGPARLGAGLVAAVLLASAIRAGAQLAGLFAYHAAETTEDIAQAVRLDPGNVTYRLLYAEYSSWRCDCATAAAQLDVARALSPWDPHIEQTAALCVGARCGGTGAVPRP